MNQEDLLMLKDLIAKNRSVRGYDPALPLPSALLKEWLDTVRLAGSAGNLQPLKYRMITSPDEVQKTNGLTRWAKLLKDIQLPHPGKEPSAYILICVDQTICKNTSAADIDIGIAAQTLLLCATECGYGGCMLGNFDKAQLSRSLVLDECYYPALLIALGKPDETIILTDTDSEHGTKYYRDESDRHFVPKRRLEDILI